MEGYISELRGHSSSGALFQPGERSCTHACINSAGDLVFVASDKNVFGYNIMLEKNFKVYTGHEGAIVDIDIDVEGNRIVSVGSDYQIIIHSVESGDILYDVDTKKFHAACCFGPRNMNYVAAVTSKQMKQEIVVTGYHILDRTRELQFKWDCKFDAPINALKWPTSDTVIAGDVKGCIHVINLSSKDNTPVTYSIQAHGGAINSISLSWDNLFFATASADTNASLWVLPRNSKDKIEKPAGTYKHDFQVSCATISPIAPHIVLASTAEHADVARTNFGSTDFTINFFHTIFQEEFASMKVFKSPVNWIGFTPDGMNLVATSAEGTFQVIRLAGDYAKYIAEHIKEREEMEAQAE